jgi:hypothetical protein
MYPVKTPSVEKQEGLEELLQGLLQTEPGQFRVASLKESVHPPPVPLGDTQPIGRVA